MHSQHHAQLFKLPPQGIELRERGVLVVGDDGANKRRLKAALCHPPQFLYRVVDVLYRENRGRVKSLWSGAAIIIDPVVVSSRADVRGLGIIHQWEIDEGGRKDHDLVDAGSVHVLQPRMGISGTGVSADRFVPFPGSGLCSADDLLGQPRVPSFSWIFPFVGISKADFRVANQNETVCVPVEVSLGEMLLVLGNVFVPNLRWFINVTVAIKNRKVLFSAFSSVGHGSP